MRDLLVNIELVYFIYVRKSTDVEDKQILSVAAQIIELKEFAKRMGLRIAGIIVEKQTAKKPGRPKFNKMLERIENGEANGVLAWLPDRLSRNSIDSGRVIYMLDENIIADHGGMFLQPIKIAGDRPCTDIDILADVRIADIGEMSHFRSRSKR